MGEPAYEGSWLNKLDIPFGYIESYVERLDRGEKIGASWCALGVSSRATTALPRI